MAGWRRTGARGVRARFPSVVNLSTVFAGQSVGIREVEDQIWLVSFMQYDLGFFDQDEARVEPGPNPFAPDKVLTMCPV